MDASTKQFAGAFQSFMNSMTAAAPEPEAKVLALLKEHFGCDPVSLPVISHTFAGYEKANVQIGLDEWCRGPGRSHQVVGLTCEHYGSQRLRLAQVVTSSRYNPVGIGPVEYEQVDIGDGKQCACLRSGMLLVRDGGRPMALMVSGATSPYEKGISVEAMAADREEAEKTLHKLRSTIGERCVHRGKIISLDIDDYRSLMVRFHQLPAVDRANIILQPGTLERVERHTIGFAKHQQRLRDAGRHLKRGLLLFGPPGTGKTFTAMYLASKMPGRTVLLVKGQAQGLIAHTCAMARALAPATVILEDADLIGMDRERNVSCTGPLLFELLNEMDGLANDCDVLFVLTTNRPDVLEPALAARPGRIDQAIEIPLPDAECRAKLLELYGRGLKTRINDRESVVKRTEGASAAFMKELLRRAALFAADRSEELCVTDKDLDEALHELVFQGGAITRSLLGFKDEAANVEA